MSFTGAPQRRSADVGPIPAAVLDLVRMSSGQESYPPLYSLSAMTGGDTATTHERPPGSAGETLSAFSTRASITPNQSGCAPPKGGSIRQVRHLLSCSCPSAHGQCTWKSPPITFAFLALKRFISRRGLLVIVMNYLYFIVIQLQNC